MPSSETRAPLFSGQDNKAQVSPRGSRWAGLLAALWKDCSLPGSEFSAVTQPSPGLLHTPHGTWETRETRVGSKFTLPATLWITQSFVSGPRFSRPQPCGPVAGQLAPSPAGEPQTLPCSWHQCLLRCPLWRAAWGTAQSQTLPSGSEDISHPQASPCLRWKQGSSYQRRTLRKASVAGPGVFDAASLLFALWLSNYLL